MKRVCLKKNQFWQMLENIVIGDALGNKVDVSGVEKKECAVLKVLKIRAMDVTEYSVEKPKMNVF